MIKKLLILCCIGLTLVTSCKKEKNCIEQIKHRKLVIITDDDLGTDIMVTILGAISSTYPDVETEFIQSKPFDIYQAAYLAEIAVKNYPSGTYFTLLVEPGASTKRFICNVNGKYIIAPDNKVISRVLYSAQHPAIPAYFIENQAVLGGSSWESLSIEQFYSRAILSMLGDISIEDFGTACIPQTYLIQPPSLVGDTVTGEILFTDNFGNCITDIIPGLLTGFQLADLLTIEAGTSTFSITYGTAYGSVPIGQNVCFVNSSQRLEMAVNYGNLSQTYGIGAGDKVKLW